MFWNKKTAALAILLVAGGIAFYFAPPENNVFSDKIIKCNAVVKELRFSCYRSVLERYFAGDIKSFSESIAKMHDLSFESKDNSYAIFGTNCHTFYHALGDLIAERSSSSDINELLPLCPDSCTSGCAMGLYKRLGLTTAYSETDSRAFFKSCPEESKHQCSHEIGHTLHDKYISSVLEVLDGLSRQHYGLEPKQYRYNLVEEANLDAPFQECRRVLPKDEWQYCYTGIGHNLFLFSSLSQGDYRDRIEECSRVSILDRERCYAFLLFRIGINEAAPLFLNRKFEEGNQLCKDVAALTGKPELVFHCHKGIGGGIGLFVESEFLHSQNPQEINERTRETILDYARLCEKSNIIFTNECFLGLLGTKFRAFYENGGLEHEIIDKLLPDLDTVFEVTS